MKYIVNRTATDAIEIEASSEEEAERLALLSPLEEWMPGIDCEYWVEEA